MLNRFNPASTACDALAKTNDRLLQPPAVPRPERILCLGGFTVFWGSFVQTAKPNATVVNMSYLWSPFCDLIFTILKCQLESRERSFLWCLNEAS